MTKTRSRCEHFFPGPYVYFFYFFFFEFYLSGRCWPWHCARRLQSFGPIVVTSLLFSRERLKKTEKQFKKLKKQFKRQKNNLKDRNWKVLFVNLITFSCYCILKQKLIKRRATNLLTYQKQLHCILQVLKKICSLHITEIVTLKSKGIYSSILDKAIFSIYHEQFIYETYQKTLLFVEIETFFGMINFFNFIVYPRNRARFFWCACAL